MAHAIQPTHPRIDAAGATSVGRQRSRNEDQFLVTSLDAPVPGGARHEATLLVVADGIGGLPHGDVASEVAVRTIADHVGGWLPGEAPSSQRESLPGVRRKLTSALDHGHEEVTRAAKQAGTDRMGTTLTLAYLSAPVFYLAHLGDSRAYVLREGELFQLTRDHTLAAELQGRLGEEVGDDSPWHHVLTKALGPSEHAEAEPEIRRGRLWPRDVLLLCTDGVTKHLDDDQLARLLGHSEPASVLAQRIVDAANAEGGSDNITATVARCLPGSSAA